MTESPNPPPDPEPGADWGRRRRGTPPPPSFGAAADAGPDLSREPSERQRSHDRTASDEARLRTEWHQVNAEWDRARGHQQGGQAGASSMPDLSALLVLLDTLRSAAPVELQERTTALIREVLLTLRSLIDWYLERLDGPGPKPEVQDIPIE
ncbi:MAG: hypothetical protein ACR2HC_06305 [Thermoleophilaceae bacterium]